MVATLGRVAVRKDLSNKTRIMVISHVVISVEGGNRCQRKTLCFKGGVFFAYFAPNEPKWTKMMIPVLSEF